MSKMTLGLMSLFALIAILGTSVISAEAAQPVKETTVEPYNLPLGYACGSATLTHSEGILTTMSTTWDDNDMIMFQTRSSDPVVDADDNIVGELKTNYTEQGHTNEKGVYKLQFNSAIHCYNGGLEQVIRDITITHNKV
jgi:hypothetical protein